MNDVGGAIWDDRDGIQQADDLNSLQRLADGGFTLDMPPYQWQFVPQEITSVDTGDDLFSQFAPFEHTPVYPGTTTGTIYLDHGAVPREHAFGWDISNANSIPIQTFVVDQNGMFHFTPIGNHPVVAIGGILILNTGELSLAWNLPPGVHHLVVSYEWNAEYDPRWDTHAPSAKYMATLKSRAHDDDASFYRCGL